MYQSINEYLKDGDIAKLNYCIARHCYTNSLFGVWWHEHFPDGVIAVAHLEGSPAIKFLRFTKETENLSNEMKKALSKNHGVELSPDMVLLDATAQKQEHKFAIDTYSLIVNVEVAHTPQEYKQRYLDVLKQYQKQLEDGKRQYQIMMCDIATFGRPQQWREYYDWANHEGFDFDYPAPTDKSAIAAKILPVPYNLKQYRTNKFNARVNHLFMISEQISFLKWQIIHTCQLDYMRQVLPD